MTAPTILNVYPADDSTGIVIGDQIRVTFDREMDEDSINTGTFVVTGPDEDFVAGPGFNPFDEPGIQDEDILSSPHMTGYVQGTISFTRVDSNGDEVDVDDTTGDGTLYRTLATFTPTAPLIPNKTYEVLIAGDEDTTDDVDTGVSTRTVFDTVDEVLTGTGSVLFGGSYTGTNTETYYVEIIEDGETGVAAYYWYRASDLMSTTTGITSTGRRILEKGIYITCSPGGNFEIGDKFSVVVKAPARLEGNYQWEFTTGSGSIETPPSTYSTTGIEEVEAEAEEGSAEFHVESTDPANREYGFEISEDPYTGETITIVFNNPVSYYTLTDTITVVSESCNGDPQFEATGELDFDIVYDANVPNTIELQFAAGQLFENNIVTITLDSTIADTDGNTLGTDYTFYFSTTYNPLYTSVRRIRLDLGPLVVNIPDETIYLAIFEASLMADADSFIPANDNGAVEKYFTVARREYTTCLAELTLVRALMGDMTLSDRMTKTLGDLQVARSGQGKSLATRAGELEACVARWQVSVQSAGAITPETSLKPQVAVKGSWAEDAVGVGREWTPTSQAGLGYGYPAGNTDEQVTERRWQRTFRKW